MTGKLAIPAKEAIRPIFTTESPNEAKVQLGAFGYFLFIAEGRWCNPILLEGSLYKWCYNVRRYFWKNQ